MTRRKSKPKPRLNPREFSRPRQSKADLLLEKHELLHQLKTAHERIVDLEAVADRTLLLFEREYTDYDQAAALRTLRAVLEHRKVQLPPLKEWKKTK